MLIKYIPTVSSLFLKWPVCACLSIPAIPVSFAPQAPAMPSASRPPFHTVAETHQTVHTAILSRTILRHAMIYGANLHFP